jgi:F0F1-type ATP synthase membrane subunit b/b'
LDAERAKSTSVKLQTTLKETNESVKKQASIIIDKAKNITKKEVPPEVRPEEMKFV